MATVNWPSSPSTGQVYEFDGNYWYYTSTGAWRKSATGGQVSQNWAKVSDYVYIDLETWTPFIDYNWTKLEYV